MHRLTSAERTGRVAAAVEQQVRMLVEGISREIYGREQNAWIVARSANASLAYFLRDCLSFMDRGFVFGLIHGHAMQTTPTDSVVRRAALHAGPAGRDA